MQLDNIVELLLAVGLPRLPLLTQQPREPEPAPGLRITLRHSFEVDPPATVTIVFESTSAKAIGPDLLQASQPALLHTTHCGSANHHRGRPQCCMCMQM
jgi:hypothetical protein